MGQYEPEWRWGQVSRDLECQMTYGEVWVVVFLFCFFGFFFPHLWWVSEEL